MIIRVVTANLRKSDAHDGVHGWRHRRDLCARTLAEALPDLICTQECRPDQRDDLLARLDGFQAWGLARTPQDGFPVNAMFWRTERWNVDDRGGYWLSASPHVPGSRGWDSASIRLANWLVLRHRQQGFRLRLISTHLDHVGAFARRRSATMLVQDASVWPADLPQVLGGDFNEGDEEPAPAHLLAHGWRDAVAAAGGTSGPTFHGFQGPAWDGDQRRIDWILVRGPVQVRSSAVIRTAGPHPWPSDH